MGIGVIRMPIGENIKRLRAMHGLSQKELAQIAGVSDKAVSTWENGTKEPRMGAVQKIADHFGLKKSNLIEDNGLEINITPAPTSDDLPANVFPIQTKKVPLLGTIAAGVPIYADENFDGYRECTEDIDADFCLKIQGDSMIGARINDGDIVFIKKQPDVDNGEIAAVLIEDEATLKRVYKEKDSLILQAENPKYAPIVYTAESYVECRIMGKAVAFQSDIV